MKRSMLFFWLIIFGSFFGSMLSTFYFTHYTCNQFFIAEEEE